jgi:hypothetical protein
MTMTNEANPTPNTREVLTALDQILASTHFKTSATQSKLLSFVVQKAVASEEIKAIHIMVELYGDSGVDIHRVKSTANHVRERLAAYHLSEGIDDLVRIELPPGPGYRPKFSYNLDGGAWRLLKQGAAAQQVLTYQQLMTAAIAFNSAKQLMPNYAPVYEGKAENGLLRVVRNHIFGRDSMHAYNERAGFEDAETALNLDRQSWRAHLVQGWMEGFAQGWGSAAADHFVKATEFNEEAVKQSISYAAFLTLIGKGLEAAEIIDTCLESWPQNAGASILAAFLIYLNRDYRRAIRVLRDVGYLIGRSDVGTAVSVLCFVESGFAYLGVHSRRIRGVDDDSGLCRRRVGYRGPTWREGSRRWHLVGICRTAPGRQRNAHAAAG